jgi:hypothetical protein
MSFLRSPVGLSNLHLFLKVDSVVFVEGGEVSYSVEEVVSGQYGSEALDILFWQSVFSIFCTTLTVAIRCCGSKKTAKAIAAHVASGEITNVCVALDRDHDNRIGSLISAPRVLYTYGYSWENDTLHNEVICDLFYAMCPIPRDQTDVTSEVRGGLDSFAEAIDLAVCADILLACKGSSLLPRDAPESVILIGANKFPTINADRIRCLSDSAECNLPSDTSGGLKSSPFVDCYGAVLAAFCYRLLLYLCHKYSRISNFSKHVFYTMAIDKFASRLRIGDFQPIYYHYRQQFDSLERDR